MFLVIFYHLVILVILEHKTSQTFLSGCLWFVFCVDFTKDFFQLMIKQLIMKIIRRLINNKNNCS